MIDIKDIQGNIIHSVPITQQSQRVEELMTSDYIQLYWNSDKNDTIEAGSYIEYKGEKFALLEPYSPRQKSEVEFEYSPQFKSKVMGWGKLPFFFYTANGDKTAKEPDWTLTGTPSNFMKCVCDALLNETGEEWTYTVDASLPASASLSFNSVDILSGLNDIANAFETEWYVDKSTNTIHLEKASIGEEVTLEVGSNVKVPSVNNTKEGYYTRFYAFGSTRNITQSYEGANVNNLVNKRLTLDPQKYPNGYKDIREGLSKDEIFSKVLIFDDVYPSAKLSISSVRNRLMYRVDESGNKIQIGTDESGNPIYDQYAIWYFKIEGFEYDRENEIEGLKPHISFQSGALNGREFEIKYYDKFENISSSDGSFNVYAGEYEIFFIEENNYIIPSMTGLIPSDGDKVVLFNIKMPSEYTQSAYEELEAALDREIERSKSDLNNYSFDSNPIAFNENNPNLFLGRKVKYVNGDYSYSTRVIKLTTKLDFLIEQNITIGNEKIKGNTQQLKEEVVSANKDLNLLATINEMTQSLQQSYTRTQQMMLEGFAAIKNIWQLKTDENGNTYAFSAFDIATQKGITMYANGGLLNIPSIYDGLPIDYSTIIRDENGVLMLNPDIDLDGGIDEGELKAFLNRENYAKKSDIPSLDGYATENWVIGKNYVNSETLSSELANYVPIGGDTDILGLKNFKKGLSIDGLSITKSQDDVIYLDANLVVRGGITMYGTNSVDVPTIMDAITTDNVNLKVVDGVLTFVGQTSGGTADSVLWDNIEGKPLWIGSSKPVYSWNEITSKPTFAAVATSGNYSDLSGVPTSLSSFIDDVVAGKYLPLSGGTLNESLTISTGTISGQANGLILHDRGGGANEGLRIKWTSGDYTNGVWLLGEPDSNRLCFYDGTSKNIVYHSGNLTPTGILTQLKTVDGSGSGLDADLLDGYNSSNFIYQEDWSSLTSADGFISHFSSKFGSGLFGGKIKGWNNISGLEDVSWGYVLMYGQNSYSSSSAFGGGGLLIPSYGNRVYLLATSGAGGNIKITPHRIITDNIIGNYNAGSATKLQTPRAIWGQSFDGSGDVSGALSGVASINDVIKLNSSGNIIIGPSSSEKGRIKILGPSDSSDILYLCNWAGNSVLDVLSNGNVLIGTTTDSGYKLDVNGTLHINDVSTFKKGLVLSGTGSETSCITFLRESGSYIYLPKNLIIGSNNADRWYYFHKQYIYPYINDVQTLGTDTNRWRNIYSILGNFSGDVTFGTKAIIDGIPIYKSQDDVLYIDGNLAVRGGITMYATDAIDVPSIIEVLPIASTSAKGIASFNPSDFAVIDGVVSYVGKSGVDESVLADYAKKTDLSRYLPLSGGQMTGNIGYTFDRDTNYDIGIPAAGSLSYTDFYTVLQNNKSFIASAYNGNNDLWYNVISLRHRNGGLDGDKYGMYLYSVMTSIDDGSLYWGRQVNGTWQGTRVILDSVNWSQYVTAADGGSYLPLTGGTINGVVSIKSNNANILSLYRTVSGGGAWIDYYSENQSSSKWRVGVQDVKTYAWESPYGDYPCRIFYDRTYGIRFEIGQKFSNVQTQTAPERATLTLISTTDNPTDLIMGANSYDWSITARGSSDDYFLGFYSARNSQYVTRMYRNGNVLVTGGITMYSDIRKKIKLQDVELTLQQIADAPLIEHYYNSDEKRTTHVGSIAQYWASMNDWFCKLDGEGYYTMEIQNAALASAISIARELQRYESKTDKKIRLLKKRIGELEDKIEELERKGI